MTESTGGHRGRLAREGRTGIQYASIVTHAPILSVGLTSVSSGFVSILSTEISVPQTRRAPSLQTYFASKTTHLKITLVARKWGDIEEPQLTVRVDMTVKVYQAGVADRLPLVNSNPAAGNFSPLLPSVSLRTPSPRPAYPTSVLKCVDEHYVRW